jgi:Zn-dependent protease
VLLVATGVDERFFYEVANAGIKANLIIAVFNLFPLPPLDGGRVLVGVLPWRAAEAVSRIEPFGFFIVLGLVVVGVLNTWWLSPLVGASYEVLRTILAPLIAIVR